MGLVGLLPESGVTRDGTYDLILSSEPAVLVAGLITGELDAAALPLNVAAALYASTGGVRVIASTNLGALFAVTGNESVRDLYDLSGLTMYSPGLGTTPQLVVDTLSASGWFGSGGSSTTMADDSAADVEPEVIFVAEAAEVVARLAADPNLVGVLPEPFATSALASGLGLRQVGDLGVAWSEVTGADLVVGVLVVADGLSPELTAELRADTANSVAWVNANPGAAGVLIAGLGILPDAQLASAAVPRARLVALTGVDLYLSGNATLEAMFAAFPALVGGAIPGASFFWTPEIELIDD